MKKCQQNIEPIGDLLEQQIHIAIVPSFTEWVEMFFEVAFLGIDLLGSLLHTTTSNGHSQKYTRVHTVCPGQ